MLDVKELHAMSYNELRETCKELDLSIAGKKTDLVDRITDNLPVPVKNRPIPTKCMVCGLPASVVGESKGTTTGGRSYITRRLRCSGGIDTLIR